MLADLLLWQFIYAPLACLLLYAPAIQYERGGRWRVLAPLTAVVGAVDIWLNYTTLALYTWDMPRRGEYTFSKRLERLVANTDWRRAPCRAVARWLNRWDRVNAPHVPIPD